MMSDLQERAEKMLRTEEPMRLLGKLRSIQFLRGVFSRASMCLPAFYYFLGSASAHSSAKETTDYAFKVAQSYAEFSHLNTLSLACRKLFDHATKQDLTGANFAKSSDNTLVEHAQYWADSSGKEIEECLRALVFLRSFFGEYSKTDSLLLKENGSLNKRIAFLKQHADRAAAHLSLENYLIDIQDIVHFTAAIVIIGEIVRSFDNVDTDEGYFNALDAAAFEAAKRTFPNIVDFRLFGRMEVYQQARFYWKVLPADSIRAYFDQLQHALG